MSIERIKKHIVENARKEAEQIVKDAEERFRRETGDARRSLEKKYREALQADEIRCRDAMQRTLAVLKGELHRKLLEVKNEVVAGVLACAVNRILALPDAEYLALMEKWLANVPDRLEGLMSVNAKDSKRVAGDFLDGINKGRKARILLNSTEVGIQGGFIVKTDLYEIDYSLDSLVKNLRTELIPGICGILQLSDIEL
jgi:vacuolar-type H+-ATPase subunit E/Vma4